MTTPLLRLVGVDKEYAATTGVEPVRVLKQVQLEIAPGDTVSIVGPSGCGKSTLLNLMGTLDRPTRGEVLFEGDNLAGLDEERLARLRNRSLGFVFQAHHLLPQCTVLENVLVPTLTGHQPSDRGPAADRARQLLERVGLGTRTGHRPGQLSGGERQRVAVVRALINQPRLVLADEPTGALDRASAESLGELLVQLNREEGVALVVVTHALGLARRMQRVFELRDGQLQAWEKAEDAE
jgi:ABC-type lipoprotein export system ATPase subunit